VRLAALLMLMVAATHALAPAAVAAGHVRGSAFGATTADVSTVTRGIELAAETSAILPPTTPVAPPVTIVTAPAPTEMVPRRSLARGPPLRGFLSAIVPSGPPAAA
jgi:hypothetical protein